MKKIAIAPLLATLLVGNTFAANVSVPFMQKAVPTEGLTISYNTNNTEKVVCIADNFYKGYLTVTENGAEKDPGYVYGNYDGQEFYFTSVGNDETRGEFDQFHVDKKGYIKLKDTNYKPHQAYASCFYVPETANINK